MFAHDKLCVPRSILNTMKRMQRSKRFFFYRIGIMWFYLYEFVHGCKSGFDAPVLFFLASKSYERSATVNVHRRICTTPSMHEILTCFFPSSFRIFILFHLLIVIYTHNVHLCVYYFQRCDNAKCILLFEQERTCWLFFSYQTRNASHSFISISFNFGSRCCQIPLLFYIHPLATPRACPK